MIFCKAFRMQINFAFITNIWSSFTTIFTNFFNIYSMSNIDYMKKLQKTTEIIRSSVRKKMSIYPWLYDFSDIFADCPETVYFDHCHLTSHGNRILAEKIYVLIADEL